MLQCPNCFEQWRVVTAESLSNLFEGKPEVSQSDDVLQAQQFATRIKTMTAFRMVRGHEQSDFIVMVQSPDRNSSESGHLSYPPGS
jgi:hypothetical protein